jgi:hypothetical protein
VISAKVFFDTCVIIDSATPGRIGNETTKDIQHLSNAGHLLCTSITVIGEMVNTSFNKDTFDLHVGITTLKRLEFDIMFPVQELRNWCILVDREMDATGRYGSSITDRTHFAYALVYECDYYVTSKGETRTLKAPKEKGGFTEVVTIEELLAKLELS